MIGVLIIPTGLGCTIGGNAGDGNPVAKLIAQCCDTLITHPNVVNASDINEMTENTLYVEGSMLDRFLWGKISLRPVKKYNKILVVANPPLSEETVNAVSAARATIGIHAEVLELSVPLRMVATIQDGIATGLIDGLGFLLADIDSRQFDALAIHTPVKVKREVALDYYRNGGINPWGGVEAKLSKLVSNAINKPVAHAPLDTVDSDDKELFLVFHERVLPRIAAEAISNCYLHSVLKGLHRAPQIGTEKDLTCEDVDFLLSPHGCWGDPHSACVEKCIPIICVRENIVCNPIRSFGGGIIVENYLEAAGLIMSMRAGVHPESVRAELHCTIVCKNVETWEKEKLVLSS